MKFKMTWSLLLGLALVLTAGISARSDGDHRGGDDRDSDHHEIDRHDQECIVSEHHENNKATPVRSVGVIVIPGAPIESTDISWVDPATERYYLADRSNFGVDIIDAENGTFAGRANGNPAFAGPATSGGGTSTTNGGGPNGILVTPNHNLWVGDGNSLVQVLAVDPNNSSTYLKSLLPGGISTAWNADAADTCDGGTSTTHYCGRADELAYDPIHHIIFIGNSGPLSTAAPVSPATTHSPIAPYGTFINADPPYNVLGHLQFPGAGGFEQPVWDPEKQRFLVTIPGKLSTAVPPVVLTPPSIHIVNPVTMISEVTYPFSGAQDCLTVTGGVTADNATVGIMGMALAPYQHILVSACNFPIIVTLNPSKVIPNPNGTFHSVKAIEQVGGGDEVWFNPGDDRFYVTGPLNGVTGNLQQLGVIDAEDSSFLQDVPEILGDPALPPVTVPPTPVNIGKNPAAFPEQNRIFSVGQITANVATGVVPDLSLCAKYNVTKTGCIEVFTHESEGEEAEARH